MLTSDDWMAIGLSLKLAGITTVFLVLLGAPLAFWLSRNESFGRRLAASLVTLPLVLPPTVLGFYLLVVLGPHGPLGALSEAVGLGYWPFTFKGLVLASIIYSLPFVVQPLQKAFEALGPEPLEAAATLGVSPRRAFFSVLLPQVRPTLFSSSILGFAHTIGEFGVVLMIGGNIPGVTRVLSMQIYGRVEAMEYGRAHVLAGGLLLFSVAVLFLMQLLGPKSAARKKGSRPVRLR